MNHQAGVGAGGTNEDEGFAKAVEEFILPRAVPAPEAAPAE